MYILFPPVAHFPSKLKQPVSYGFPYARMNSAVYLVILQDNYFIYLRNLMLYIMQERRCQVYNIYIIIVFFLMIIFAVLILLL